jgi:hypothetical protein
MQERDTVPLSKATNKPTGENVKIMAVILPAETRGMLLSIRSGSGVSSGVLWEAQLRDI